MLINQQSHNRILIARAEQRIRHDSVNALLKYCYSIIDKHETTRLQKGVNLVAADGPISQSAQALLSCHFSSRASGGAIGRNSRLFTGLDEADEIEALCIALLKYLFNCHYADHRPVSGLSANTIVYAALKQYFGLDQLMAISTLYGGNSSNHLMGPPGVLGFSISDIPMDPVTLRIDLNRFEDLASRTRPPLVSLGAGINLFPYPVREVKEIISRWGGVLFFDGSHQAGLIAGGVYPNPLQQGADIYAASTGKSLSGPQGGLLCWNSENWSSALETTIFPTLVGSHQLNRVAALVVTCLELKAYGREYMESGIINAKLFARCLREEGVDVLFIEDDFTETHQVLVKWHHEEGARSACYRLATVGIFVNAVPLPDDEEQVSGIRFGLTELTRLGIRPCELRLLAEVTAGVLIGRCKLEFAGEVVTHIASRFSGFNYTLED
ncbi:serine hydroxymethyltransferase [Vibrio sp. VNB-15]